MNVYSQSVPHFFYLQQSTKVNGGSNVSRRGRRLDGVNWFQWKTWQKFKEPGSVLILDYFGLYLSPSTRRSLGLLPSCFSVSFSSLTLWEWMGGSNGFDWGGRGHPSGVGDK